MITTKGKIVVEYRSLKSFTVTPSVSSVGLAKLEFINTVKF